MAINRDRPACWAGDRALSVAQFNAWYSEAAPRVFRAARATAINDVADALRLSDDLQRIDPTLLLNPAPYLLKVLRAACAPPLARDRLIGLSQVRASLVQALEAGTTPRSIDPDLHSALGQLCALLQQHLDRDLFPWLEANRPANAEERRAASLVLADRLCGDQTDTLLRNQQEQRQLSALSGFLTTRRYQLAPPPPSGDPAALAPGTYCTRANVLVKQDQAGEGLGQIRIPIDLVVQPHTPRPGRFPHLLEAKSAGDVTNTNKRRKEEATKSRQLVLTYGADAALVLILCGYFDDRYLGYEAREGLDWIWEHRLEDLCQLGL